MSALFVLLAIGLLMAGGAVAAYIWAVRDGQMEDLRGPAERLVVEDHLTAIQPTAPDVIRKFVK